MAHHLVVDCQEVISLDSPARHLRRLVGLELCHNNLQLIDQPTGARTVKYTNSRQWPMRQPF